MVFRDVTLQKKLQQQLELADRLASLGTLAAGVAHEINNPLAVITGNTHLLSEELKELQADLQSRPAGGPEAESAPAEDRAIDRGPARRPPRG